jgi:peptidoglycan/LPS O-acetylase OafA/YrhL
MNTTNLTPEVRRLATTDSSVLDVLRAVAVLAVLIAHLMKAAGDEAGFWLAQQLGWLGVMLFFVHTSLVLMFSLERTKADGMQLAIHYYVRRAFRIYPLSIAIVLSILAFAIPVASLEWQPADTSPQTVLANILLVQNLVYAPNVLGPLWSLPLEVQMYVMLPFLYLIVRRGTRLDIAITLWAGSVGLALLQPLISNRLNVFQYSPCFMGGIIAFCVSKRRAATLPFWSWVMTLGVVVATFLFFTADPDQHYLLPASWVLGLTVGFIVARFEETTLPLVRRPAAIIAKYSYGIYLTHMIALWIAFVKIGPASLAVRVLVGAGLTAVFSALAYHLVEVPGIRIGARIANRLLDRRFIPGPSAAAAVPGATT